MRSGTGRSAYDLATLVGLGGGLAMVIAAMALGGSARSFLDLPSVLIVLGGTAAVTTACFTLPEVGRAMGVIARTVLKSDRDPSREAIRLIQLAEAARRGNVLALQKDLNQIDQPFLRKGLGLVIDGTSGEEIEAIMRQDMQATAARHYKAAGVLHKAAEVSPAMGLIGTLIGLVQMLGNLDDPSTIGPSMAVALLTTFYGAILANMVFSPLAAKLERNTTEEALVHQLQVMGVVSIGRQENPRRLEMLLNSALPPGRRVRYFD